MMRDHDRATPETTGLPRWLLGIERVVSWITAALLASLVLLTVVDVGGRYGFNHPLAGTAEWIELAMAWMIFGGFFQAATRSEHIRIDLLDHLWGPAALRRVQSFGYGVSALALLFIAWRIWIKGLELADFGDTSSYLGVPLAPMAYVMAVASALTGIVYALQSVRIARGRFAPSTGPLPTAPSQEGA
ncbi:MAG: TRAP transporter small permease [Burkholderiaceae bacterium]